MFVAELFIEFCEEFKTFAENILRRVHIPVVMAPTFRADPLAHTEILDGGVLESAISARLRGGVEPVHREENASAPEGLVLKLPPKFAPRRVRDVTSETVILHHPTHVEILNEDDTKFTSPAEKAPTFRYGDESARQAWRFWKILL